MLTVSDLHAERYRRLVGPAARDVPDGVAAASQHQQRQVVLLHELHALPVTYEQTLQTLGQGNLFTGVCDSVNRGGGASLHAGIPTPPASRHPPEQTPCPPRNRHPPGIRLTSGRYASYWNAYLFLLLLYKFHALPVTYQQTLRVPHGSFTRIFFFDLCHCSLWTSNWTSYEREGTLTPILRWWSRTENHNFSTNHW